MDEQTKALQQERIGIFTDIYNNIVPKRSPSIMLLRHFGVAELADVNTIDFQYDYSKIIEATKSLCNQLYSDTMPIAPISLRARNPIFYQILDSCLYVMADNGFNQIAPISVMEPEEYRQLIDNPFDFYMEKIIPRQYNSLDTSCGIKREISIQMANAALADSAAEFMPAIQAIMDEHGYYTGAPKGSFGFTHAPGDFIADYFRGLPGYFIDIRRDRQKVIEASDALVHMLYQAAKPDINSPLGFVDFPLHIPPFMRYKDVAEVYMPSFGKILRQLAANGYRPSMFAEGDWTAVHDLLYDYVPAGSQIMFQDGDRQKIKDKFGDKFIIQGMYPAEILKFGTKEQVIDEAKKHFDIFLSGGGVYLFHLTQPMICKNDISMENYAALSEYIRDYAHYDNAGSHYGQPLNVEGFMPDSKLDQPLDSKYLFKWEDFKKANPLVPDFAKKKYEKYVKQILQFYYELY